MTTRRLVAVAVVLGLLTAVVPVPGAAPAAGTKARAQGPSAARPGQAKADPDTSLAETIRDLEIRCCLYYIVDQLQLRPEQVQDPDRVRHGSAPGGRRERCQGGGGGAQGRSRAPAVPLRGHPWRMGLAGV